MTLIPFNDWSMERIRQGRKISTARHKRYAKDPRVWLITKQIPWGKIKKYFWMHEGANNPEELQTVIESIYKRTVRDEELFYLHFGDFK